MKALVSGQADSFLIIEKDFGELYRGASKPVTIPLVDWQRAFSGATDIMIVDVESIEEAKRATELFHDTDIATRYILSLLDPLVPNDNQAAKVHALEGLLDSPSVRVGIECLLYSKPLPPLKYPELLKSAAPVNQVRDFLAHLFENQDRIAATRLGFDNLLSNENLDREQISSFEALAIQWGIFREFVQRAESPDLIEKLIQRLQGSGFDDAHLMFVISWAASIPGTPVGDPPLRDLIAACATSPITHVSLRKPSLYSLESPSRALSLFENSVPLRSVLNLSEATLPEAMEINRRLMDKWGPYLDRGLLYPWPTGRMWLGDIAERNCTVSLIETGNISSSLRRQLLWLNPRFGKKRQPLYPGVERIVIAEHLTQFEAEQLRETIEDFGGKVEIINTGSDEPGL